MTNMMLYQIKSKGSVNILQLVERIKITVNDDVQGIIIHEYNEGFLKATYWKKKIRRESRYNIDRHEFELFEEEIVNVADFVIQMDEEKLLIFGSKDMAQRIITIVGVVSKNSFFISEFIINIEKLLHKISLEKQIELLKMKLIDIPIEKNILVSCGVNLSSLDEPYEIALKYVNNIMVLSFKLKQLPVVVTIYKTGKVSIGKITEDEQDELVQILMQIVE